MLRRLLALRDRYCAARLILQGRPQPILNRKGTQIGFIDQIEVAEGRLRVAGWVTAALAKLVLAGSEARMVPGLHRMDVALAHDISADVGFDLSVPCFPHTLQNSSAPGLILHPRPGDADISPLVLELPWTARAKIALTMRFARDLLVASPSIFRWYATRDPVHRARIKYRLGLNTMTVAEDMVSGLLTDSPADALPVLGFDIPPRITVVMPVFNAFELLAEVLDRIARHTDMPWRLILIEDKSTDARVRPFLRDWVATHAPDHDVALIENDENRGFIRSVNDGLSRAMEHVGTDEGPVVLLNSDAFLPADWSSRLVQPLLRDSSIASATPMSNDAEIFSVPVICAKTDLTCGQGDRIDTLARQFQREVLQVEVPTGVGFCMALHRDWLARQPSLDTVFGRGYGEEVDWCQKIRMNSGRHVAVPELFVEHRGGESFGSDAKRALVARNNDIVSKRYPRYDGEVQQYIRSDPLATARLALGLAWAGSLALDQAIPIYLAHTLGGGAEMWLETRIAEILARGIPVVVMRVGSQRLWQIELHTGGGVTRGSTDDTAFMHRLLAPLEHRKVIYSCGVGAPDPVTLPVELQALARHDTDSVEILFHDFFPLSPSYTLLDADGIYRGPPDAKHTDKAHQVRTQDGRIVSLAEWQSAWKRLADRAETLQMFSIDSADQVRAVWPDLADRIKIRPHTLSYTPPALPVPTPNAPMVVGVLGNIGVQKGAAVLQKMAQELRASDAAPSLVVIGNFDPAYPLPGSVKVHGSYRTTEIPHLVQTYGVTHWLIPSVWPETFSYTTHEALATGLPVLAFDIGAQGAAVRNAPNGVPVPLDTPSDETKERSLVTSFGAADQGARNVLDALKNLRTPGSASPPEARAKMRT